MGCWLRMVTSVVVLAMVTVNPAAATDALDCSNVVRKLLPCQPFLFGAGSGGPSAECCSGAQELDKIAAGSPTEKKTLCQCLVELARSFPINYEKANQLPKLCSLTTHFTIGPATDCSK